MAGLDPAIHVSKPAVTLANAWMPGSSPGMTQDTKSGNTGPIGIAFIKSFGTKIWKAGERFVNISGKGYWPRDVDCPDAGYKATENSSQSVNEESKEEGLFGQ